MWHRRPPSPGGTGGDAGSDGGDGTPCPSETGGTGGDAGSQSAGGSGGSPEGQSGSLGLGGNGGGNFGGGGFGGGGGGGYYGGGGGGGLNRGSAAGGGGGGSNLVPTGGTATIATTIGPSITISYTVPDNTAPSITAPPNITVEATGTDGAAVEFGTDEANGCSATDNADPQPVISYDPQSGSTFPIGTTPVTCTATDSSGNFATATFSVTVEDTAAPKVISTSPRDGGEVGPAANIRATFSEEMQSASVINAFKLFKKGSTNRIAAQVSYDAMTDTATLNPTTNLRRGATYKAVVSTVAEDEAGNRLDQNGSKDGLQQKVWFFEIDN